MSEASAPVGRVWVRAGQAAGCRLSPQRAPRSTHPVGSLLEARVGPWAAAGPGPRVPVMESTHCVSRLLPVSSEDSTPPWLRGPCSRSPALPCCCLVVASGVVRPGVSLSCLEAPCTCREGPSVGHVAATSVLTHVPVPCSITVPLKRLKHFDCKDKQALLVGGFLPRLLVAYPGTGSSVEPLKPWPCVTGGCPWLPASCSTGGTVGPCPGEPGKALLLVAISGHHEGWRDAGPLN